MSNSIPLPFTDHFSARLAKAWAAFTNVSKTFHSTGQSDTTDLGFYFKPDLAVSPSDCAKTW